MDAILFVSLMNYAPWGGSEELWYQTALFAAKQGHKVGCAFYEWPQNSQRVARLKAAGCDVYLFANKGRQKRNFWERLQFKITKRRVKAYAGSLPFSQYHFTVINLGYMEIISPYWKDFYRYIHKYTLLFHVHNENVSLRPTSKKRIKTWVEHARHNLFASVRTKAYLEKQLGLIIPGSDLLINPLTFAAPTEPPAFPPLLNSNCVFVMLATLDVRRKAQDNLIKVLSSDKWKERSWILYLYGSGDDESLLSNLIAEKSLGSKVFLKGHVHDVKAALAEAHVLLQITHIDAMPLSVTEGLAMARPVVVSNVGDMPEWVAENTNGWISNDASEEAMDSTLEKCWRARNRWEEMGKVSFHLFKEKFPAAPEAFFLSQLKS